jgi:5,10-methylenetetrahydromethanopterin reductase
MRWLSDLCQNMSLDGIWIGEDIDRPHDVFIMTSIALLRTSAAKVGIGITSPLIRNLSTTARAAVALQELGLGRFILGLGVGGLRDLAEKGITVERPSELLKDAADLLRRVWSGEKVTSSRGFTLDEYSLRRCLQTPIYFGVRGPRLLKLAGEVADGVIISGPRRYIEKATALVKEGLKRRRERPPNAFDIVVWVPTILIRHGEDLNLARETVALVAADAPEQIIEMAEIDRAEVQTVREAVFRVGVKEAARLVTEDLLRDFSIYGDEGQICQSFHSLAKYGVNKVVFGPPYGRNWRNAATDVVGAWRNQT